MLVLPGTGQSRPVTLNEVCCMIECPAASVAITFNVYEVPLMLPLKCSLNFVVDMEEMLNVVVIGVARVEVSSLPFL